MSLPLPYGVGIVDPQNPIDWSHPLNYGLVCDFTALPNSGWAKGPSYKNLVAPVAKSGTFFVTGSSLLPTWTAKPRRGGYAGINCPTVTSFAILPLVDYLLPVSQGTISLWQRKTDSTLRASVAFGQESSTNSERALCHMPYSDGTAYFDWGGTSSGSSRLAVSGLSFDTNWHHWVFTVGNGLGIRMYRDGVLLGSNAGAPTRTTNGSSRMFINLSGSADGDLADYDGFKTYNRALSGTEVANLYAEEKAGNPNRWRWLLRGAWFPSEQAASGNTFTATAALTVGAVTAAASATFAPGTKTATAALNIAPVTSAASGTFTKPVYSATAPLSIAPVTSASSATFTNPIYSATSVLSIAPTTLAASATFTAPVYSATASLTAAPATLAATAIFATEVYSASAPLTIAPATLSASATYSAGTRTASASLSIAGVTVSASGTFTAPIYTGSAALTIGATTCAGSAIFSASVSIGTAGLVIGAVTFAATATFTSGQNVVFQINDIILWREPPNNIAFYMPNSTIMWSEPRNGTNWDR